MYFIYILYSEGLDRYYVGVTSELSSRLDNHLSSKKGFTSMAKDWELKYSEAIELKAEAYARERAIKKWKSRIMLKKLIASQ